MNSLKQHRSYFLSWEGKTTTVLFKMTILSDEILWKVSYAWRIAWSGGQDLVLSLLGSGSVPHLGTAVCHCCQKKKRGGRGEEKLAIRYWLNSVTGWKVTQCDGRKKRNFQFSPAGSWEGVLGGRFSVGIFRLWPLLGLLSHCSETAESAGNAFTICVDFNIFPNNGKLN